MAFIGDGCLPSPFSRCVLNFFSFFVRFDGRETAGWTTFFSPLLFLPLGPFSSLVKEGRSAQLIVFPLPFSPSKRLASFSIYVLSARFGLGGFGLWMMRGTFSPSFSWSHERTEKKLGNACYYLYFPFFQNFFSFFLPIVGECSSQTPY